MKYILNRLYLENFKLIPQDKPKLIDFSKSADNLIVLSGPNGFGKTTIFDALEIVFTNNISRIQSIIDRRTRRIDNFLANSKEQNVIIKAELKKQDEYLTIVKIIPFNSINNNEMNLSENIETYFFYDTLESANDYKPEKKISNKLFKATIYEHLNINSKDFNIINYISQEETTHYLKRGEKERQEVFDTLFNLEHLIEKINKLKNINKNIESHEKSMKEKIKDIYKDMDNSEKIEQEQNNYVELILHKEKPVLWDIINPKITSYEDINIIEALEYFIKYSNEFKNDLFNNEINIYLEDNTLIKDFIYLKGTEYINSFNDINKLNKKYTDMLNVYNNFKEENIIKSFNEQECNNICNKLNYDIDSNFILNKINIINNYKNMQSQNKGIINSFNNLRIQIKEEFDKFNIYEIEENKCPLCNADFEDKMQLIKSIENKTKDIEKLLDDSFNSLNKEIKELNEYIEPMRIIIKEKLDEFKDEIIEDELFNNVKTSFKNKENVIKLYKFLKKNNIIEKVINSIDENNIDDSYKIIMEMLRALFIPLSPEYKYYKEQYDFDNIYINILFKNRSNIEYILNNKELLGSKKSYLESCYKVFKQNEQFKKEKEFKKLKIKLITIYKLKNSIKDIIDIYNSQINKFKYEIIPIIEIPLFIYTGKIIQNHQRGLGVFIDNGVINSNSGENEELKKIRFVPNMETKHDIVNTFSSGQLSGFIMAFTMVMNKIYSNDDLNMILIDDPVQTMDEINISSLVEVLRNEFADTQIILSTHEPMISNYIRYKFSKYSIDSLDYNVKNNFKL